MFIKEKRKKIIHLILYVDNALITSEDENRVDELKKKLRNVYTITALEEAKYDLGIESCRQEDGSCPL